MKILLSLFSFDTAKVLAPPAVFTAIITVADVKDMVVIVGGIVTITCTILVTRSNLRKNAVEIKKNEEK